TFIFVTNEIGSGGVSTDAIQRRFTDLQGWMNQYVASKADFRQDRSVLQVHLPDPGLPVVPGRIHGQAVFLSFRTHDQQLVLKQFQRIDL
ncbi:MAG: bifunctional adenosylcobinamide kinase/adenosylcobinamide-phosphate guanylyltransferase, partial [Erysipelotrichaceae bacterium]|nr:bifunctional adenosylcobinamide kinase/adenosylcobinamide-phosphate guanylyltransferase [Erysipelotrichaceae bacterium]